MSDEIKISATGKREKYIELLPQLEALVLNETDPVANMANICSALKYGMNFFWVGFYLVKNEELVLGPFQGPVACTRIAKGRGVCGAAWDKARPVIVEDVDKFPGHIACNSASRSEIVLPVVQDGMVKGVLDVDSDELAGFDEIDEQYLGKIIELINI
jgi:L-methionine (R)-S-oxide reductase